MSCKNTRIKTEISKNLFAFKSSSCWHGVRFYQAVVEKETGSRYFCESLLRAPA